jgi:hypothetical protein
MRVGGGELCRRGRLAEVQQEAGRRRIRIVEDQIAPDWYPGGDKRRAAFVHQPRARIAARERIGADSRDGCGAGRGGAKGDELPAFHAPID